MGYLLSCLAGFALGILGFGAWRRTKARLLPPASSLPEASAPTTPPTEPDSGTRLEPLTAGLHRLAPEVESFAERTAHPRELTEHPPFREIVRMFSPSETPLSTLRQYILGDNWPLSCGCARGAA